MAKNEIWKNIPGYENYQASNFGNIRSLNYKRTGIIKVLKPIQNISNYLWVNVFSNNKRNRIYIHRLVCFTFLGINNKYKEVNHKNGIKSDNRLENLEWCDRKKNMQHAMSTGLFKNNHSRGENSANAKLTNNQANEIRQKFKNGKNKASLAREYNVGRDCIRRLVNNETYKYA
jgi:hypothetical protein